MSPKPTIPRASASPHIVVLLYAVFSALWIASSDWLLGLIIDDPEVLVRLGAAKGFIFVAVTSGLLYLLLKGWRSAGRDAGSAGTARTQPPLRNLILILMMLTAVVPLIGFGIVRLHGPRLEQAAYSNLQAIAKLKAGQIENWLEERRKAARSLANSRSFIRDVDKWTTTANDEARSDAIDRLDNLQKSYGYQIDLADVDNRILFSTSERAEPPDQTQLTLLAAAYRSGRIQFRDLYQDADQHVYLDYIVPLFTNSQGGSLQATGAVILHVPADTFLYPLMQHWPTPSASAETTLVRGNTDGIAILNELRYGKGAAFAKRFPASGSRLPAAVTVLSAAQQTLEGRDYRDAPVLAAVLPVPGTPWHLVAKIDRDEVMSPLRILVLWVSIIAFFAVLCIIGAVLLLWRQQARHHRLELLARAADKDKLMRHFYELPLIGMAIASSPSRKMIHVNNQLCDILHYTREEMTELSWPNLIHQDDLGADSTQYQRMLTGEIDGHQGDSRLIRKDGTVIDAIINIQCVRNSKGEIELELATVQDVTERKSIEVALRKNEADLNRAQHISQTGSWMLDARLNTLRWSTECYRIFGVAADTPLTYELFLKLVHPDDRAYVDQKWKEAMQGAAYDIEHRIVVGGQIKWIRERAELQFDDSGDLIAGIGTAQDVTERKIIEMRLKESESILRQSQRIANIGHYVFDVAGGSWTSSELLDQIFGVDDSIERNVETWINLVHPEQRSEMLAYLQNHVLRDLNPFDREYRIIRACDGVERRLHGMGRLEVGTDGKPHRMLGTIQDITERAEVETALRESEERLRQAVRASHIGIFDHDKHSDTIFWSSEQRQIFGIPADEPVSLDVFLDCVHPEDREAVADATRRAHDPEGDGLFDMEFRIIRRDGETRWVTARAQTIFEAKEGVYRPARSIGAVVDVTERKVAEIVLLESKERYRALEERFRIIYEEALDGILLIDRETAKFVMSNPAFNRMIGYAPEETTDLGIADIVRETDLDYAMEQFKKHVDGISPLTPDMPIKRKDGSIIYVDAHSSPVRMGENIYQLGVLRDVTERRKNEERLRLAAAVFDSSREGIMIVDADKKILMVNRAFCEMKGYSEHELLGREPSLFRSGRHDAEYYAAMWWRINNAGYWQGEIWNRRKSGEVIPELVSISVVKDLFGGITHYVGIYTDISHLKATEEKLEFMAHHDPLTQLPNRLLIHSRLEHCLEVARREGRSLALLMLDLDRFKDVNDSFGHLAGDELLLQVSNRLVNRLRGADTVARLGGDEFALLLDNPTHPQDAESVAEEIIAMLGEPWRLANGAEIRIGTSVGISLFPKHGQTAELLFQQADAALYRAKSEGRACTRYFSDEMTQSARNRVVLETELRHAINKGELQVYFQPQVDIASDAIIGAEALLRWQHPERGMISPAQFIPVAEETGLIGQIGAWVMRETCRQGRQWLDAGLPALTLSVNLSAQQFLYSDICAMVAKVLAETGFPADHLELELTESVLMEREGEAETILQHLRAQNVRLAIDDFGTGYSSLAYLKRFPINVLKIDKRFIEDIPHEQDDMAITAAIIAMAHTMGFKVLAEGVETPEQLAYLHSQKCDRYQGYLASAALPTAEFEALLVNAEPGQRIRAG